MRGKWVNGLAPFGYKYNKDNKKLETNATQKKVYDKITIYILWVILMTLLWYDMEMNESIKTLIPEINNVCIIGDFHLLLSWKAELMIKELE